MAEQRAARRRWRGVVARVALGLLGGAGLVLPAVAAAPPVPQVCEVDAGDASAVAWVRLQQVTQRIAERCRTGDVVVLFPFSAGTNAADVVQIAPMICRMDHQILLHPAGGDAGPNRLICTYGGRIRQVR